MPATHPYHLLSPPSSQILVELLQNCDDARAQKVKFLLDKRTHGKQSILKPEMGYFQGPALYQYDEGRFEVADFSSLCNPGRSVVPPDAYAGQVRLPVQSNLYRPPREWQEEERPLEDRPLRSR